MTRAVSLYAQELVIASARPGGWSGAPEVTLDADNLKLRALGRILDVEMAGAVDASFAASNGFREATLDRVRLDEALRPRLLAFLLILDLDHCAPLSRSVEDMALLLNVIAGFDPGDPADFVA